VTCATVCARKRRHRSEAGAVAWAVERGYHETQEPYSCALCRGYHLRTRRRPYVPRPAVLVSRELTRSAVHQGWIAVEQVGDGWRATARGVVGVGPSQRAAVSAVIRELGAPEDGTFHRWWCA
jgi:hypothetical protein